jgi:hypothetical protein
MWLSILFVPRIICLNSNVILHIIKSSKLLFGHLMGKELGVLRDFETFLSLS